MNTNKNNRYLNLAVVFIIEILAFFHIHQQFDS